MICQVTDNSVVGVETYLEPEGRVLGGVVAFDEIDILEILSIKLSVSVSANN